MFVTPAFAQTAGAASGGAAVFAQFLPIVLIFVIFYFLLIRPQQKKMKDHRAMLGSIKRGDRVITAGGIVATSAPSLAACNTCTGWRTLATRIWVSKA